VDQLREIPHARDVEQTLDWVFGAGMHTAYFPRTREEVDAIVRACIEPGRVNLLVDEAHTWLTSRKGVEGPLLKLMRAHRHARANVLLTSQHFTADIPQEARSCAPRIYVFRCTGPRVLEVLAQEGVPSDVVSALPQLSFLEHYTGF
jgi:hypothetical protein